MGVIHLSYPYSRLCTRSILHSGGGERRQVYAVVDGLPLHLHKQRRQRDGQIRQHEQGEREGEGDLLPRRGVDTLPLAGHGNAAQHQQRGEIGYHPGDNHRQQTHQTERHRPQRPPLPPLPLRPPPPHPRPPHRPQARPRRRRFFPVTSVPQWLTRRKENPFRRGFVYLQKFRSMLYYTN